MTTDNETVVRRFYESLATGDPALADETLADGWEAVPPLHTGSGPAGWRTTVEHFRAAFGELTVEIEDVVASGDRVAVRAVSRARHTGEMLGIAATGREVEIRAADFHQVTDGRIVRTWHLEDHFGLARQIGE